MKALKILGIVFGGLVGLIVVGGVVFYVGWLMPPSQESVCANAVPLLIEANEQRLNELPEALRAEARAKAESEVKKACQESTEVPEFGRLPYVAQMKCMKRARSVAELKECDSIIEQYR